MTFSRQLPSEPAPPRTVIIERLPPLPPKPRDIIIERWLPYEILNKKRQVIVHKAQKTNVEQAKPKNIIITFASIEFIDLMKRELSVFLFFFFVFVELFLVMSLFKPRSYVIFKSKMLSARIQKCTHLDIVHSCMIRTWSFNKHVRLVFMKTW
jgi:hypothetical protein